MADLKEAASMLNKDNANRISGKIHDIEKITDSPDGKAVESILEKNGDRLTRALENNDTAAMARELSKILNTKAGANVINQLAELFH